MGSVLNSIASQMSMRLNTPKISKLLARSPEYFSEYKIRELCLIANRQGETPSSVFDFGSGIGNSIPYFREYFAGATLTCGDVSSRSIELSKSRYPGDETYTLIEGDRIPIENDSFDLTFSACVFHHIPHRDHTRWFRELFRITRSGGMIVVFEHNPLNPLTVQAVRRDRDRAVRRLRSRVWAFNRTMTRTIRYRNLNLSYLAGKPSMVPITRYHAQSALFQGATPVTSRHSMSTPTGAAHTATNPCFAGRLYISTLAGNFKSQSFRMPAQWLQPQELTVTP